MMSTIASGTVDPVVAVYDSPAQAEAALSALSGAGWVMDRISVVGERYRAEQYALGFYSTGDRIMAWGGAGGFWDTVWRILSGPAVSVVPQVGLVAAAGPFGLALISARDRALDVGRAGGVSALSAALASLGVPIERALKYEGDVKAHRVLFLIQGSADDIARARSLLATVTQQAPAVSAARPREEGATRAGTLVWRAWPTHG